MHRSALFARARRAYGFTLLELLISLVVAAIILSIGLPAFSTLSARSQQTAEINGFIRHLQLARSHAVKTGRDHILCPSTDLADCLEATAWEQGYLLFEDADEDRLRDEDESLVKVERPNGRIRIRSSSGRTQIVYRPDGRSAGSNLTLVFCESDDLIPPKAVILSNTGRARIATTRSDGTPLSCDH